MQPTAQLRLALLAASEADRLGLKLAIASSPGWSEAGGPWVPSQDGPKKVVE